MIPSYDPQRELLGMIKEGKVLQMKQPATLLWVILPVLVGFGEARADPRSGLSTGGAHHAVVAQYRHQGLERGMPRKGWYVRGIELDLQKRWRESAEAFRKARYAFVTPARADARQLARVNGWREKARFLETQSRRLQRRTYSRMRMSSYMQYQQAEAMHHKWLAARAFTGRSHQAFAEEVVRLYQQLLRKFSIHNQGRVMLAAMYHELGQHARARQEFSRVSVRRMRGIALYVAYYYTVARDRKKAFEHLEIATKYRGHQTTARQCNFFDSLQGDPRLKKLLRRR